MALGCAFAIWNEEFPENVLPPGLGFLAAILCTALSYSSPHVMAFIGFYPAICVVILLVFIIVTVFLAGATVSKGLLVALYSIVSLFSCTFWWGKEVFSLKAFVSVFCGCGALFTISLLPGVEANGISFVTDLWKTGGFIPNVYLVLGWFLAIQTFSIMFPLSKDHFLPTVTHLVSRKVLPSCLEACASILEECGFPEPSATKLPNEEVMVKSLHTLETLQETLNGGAIANMAIYEIRLFRAPLQETVKYLGDLAKCIDAIIVSTFEITSVIKEGGVMLLEAVPVERKKVYLDSIKVCARALKEGKSNEELSSFLQDMSNGEKDETNARRNARALVQSTYVWLEAYNNPSSTKDADNVKHLAKPVVMLGLGLFVLLAMKIADVAKLTWHPTMWKWSQIGYTLKQTAGYVALFCMTIYWDNWHNFRIQTGAEEVGPVFNGWALLGYAMAWLITREGTVKKGSQRILGTLTGGFFAWLAPIVCSGGKRHPEAADISRVGYFFYIIGILMVSTYLTYPPGLASYFGADKEHGAFGSYFTLTLVMIGLEIQGGKGSGDDLVANRVVATITGVAMSIFIQCLPPSLAGGDPRWAREAYEKQREAFQKIVSTLLIQAGKFAKEAESPEEGVSKVDTLLEEAADKRKYALMLYKDANQFRSIPIWNPDPALLQLIQGLHLNEFLLEHLQGYAKQNRLGIRRSLRSSTPDDVESDAVEIDETDELVQIQKVYDAMTSRETYVEQPPETGPMLLTLPFVNTTSLEDAATEAAIQDIAAVVAILNKRYADHQQTLDSLVSGVPSSGNSEPAIKTRIET